MVRLTDLDPSWTVDAGGIDRGRRGMGISFLCPKHGATGGVNGSACYLGIWFENPVDEGPAYDGGWRKPRPGQVTADEPLWRREGETFETLTVSPSIDVEGHWHGWIRNGDVT